MIKHFKPPPKSFKNTFCVFKEVDKTTVFNLKPNYSSESGSTYYYTEMGMYRLSNHWGRLANSKWRLIALEPNSDSKFKLGFAKWEDFYPDNTTDKLYYITVDFDKKTANYQHCNNPEFDGKAFLRDTKETSKRLKQVKNILTLTNWATYFDTENIEELRITLINEMIFTNKSLISIKNEFLNKSI